MPCKAIAPAVKKVAGELGVDVVEINIDEQQEEAAKYGIRSIPALVLLKDEAPVDIMVGMASEQKLKDFITKYKEG